MKGAGSGEINVKVRSPQKGVTILHRPGYYAPRATADKESYEQRIDAVEWLLMNVEASELEVEVFAETLTDPLGGLRVEVAVDVAGPSFMRSSRTTRRLDLRLAVEDGDGNVRELLTGEARPGKVSDDLRLGGGGVRFEGDLALPPGDYRLRVMVMGLPGGEVYLAGHAMTVAVEPQQAMATLAAPGERDPASWLIVDTVRRSAFFR